MLFYHLYVSLSIGSFNPVAKEVMLEKSSTLNLQERENYKSMPSIYSQLVVG